MRTGIIPNLQVGRPRLREERPGVSWLRDAQSGLEPQSSASKLLALSSVHSPCFCSAFSSRLSRRRTRSSRLGSRHLRSKDKVEKLATVVGENGSVLRRVTRAAAAAMAATAAAPSPTPESPTALTKKPKSSLEQCQLVPVVEIGVCEHQSAEQHLNQLKSAQAQSRAPSPTPAPATAPASHVTVITDEKSTPEKSEAGRLESVTVSSLMATPQDPKGRGVGAGRSASKLRIARASPGPHDSPGSPASPWQERVLDPILPGNFSTPTGARVDSRSVRRSLIAPSSPGAQVSLVQKYSLVAKKETTVRRSSRRIAKKATEEPAASARIICESGCRQWDGVRCVILGPCSAGGALGNHLARSCPLNFLR